MLLDTTPPEDEPSDEFSMITFYLDRQKYGIPITAVRKVIEMVTITHLPEAPVAVQGIINVQGTIVPVLDLRLRLGYPYQAYGLNTPIILVEINDKLVGLVADAVETVATIDEQQILPNEKLMPSDDDSEKKSCLPQIARVDRQMVPVLDVTALLTPTEETTLMHILLDEAPENEGSLFDTL